MPVSIATVYKRVALIILLFFAGNLAATHIIGGEIFYDCLGGNRFKVTIKIYRDCLAGEAPYDDPLALAVYHPNGVLERNIMIPYPGSRIIPPEIINPCFQDNANLCVEEAVYVQEVLLPPSANGYVLAYQRCCRNNSIQNLIDPGATGSTYTTRIPGSAFTDCNSSPHFTSFPPIVLCVNDTLIFNSGALDPEGDEIVYSLCSPYSGATTLAPQPVPAAPPPYANVVYRPEFSESYPISSNPQISIDPQTGLIKVVPNRIGQFVIGVCASEYRNGVHLSTTLRDFQFNVLNCGNTSVARFRAPASEIDIEGFECKGLEVNFINNSLGAGLFLWDFGVPGITTDRSNLRNPVYTYPDTGTYQVMLVTNPGYSCNDTAISTIRVYHPLEVSITPLDPGCISSNSFNFSTIEELPENVRYAWEFSGPASYSASLARYPPPVSYSDTGIFQVRLRVDDPHCSTEAVSEVMVLPELYVDFSAPATNECVPFAVKFNNNSVHSPDAVFHWDFGDNTTSSLPSPVHVYDKPGLYTVSLRVHNKNGCIDTASAEYPNLVNILPRPKATLEADPLQADILTPEIQFFDHSESAVQTWFVPDGKTVLQNADTIFRYEEPGNYKPVLVAVNSLGCRDTAVLAVEILTRFICYIPNAFTPDGDGINETFGPIGLGFADFEFSIFNRWGEMIYYTKDPKQPWDGVDRRGKMVAPSGIYHYELKILDEFKESHYYVGWLALIR